MTTGGYIGAREDDSVPTMLAPGEVWLTARQLALLRQAAPRTLDGMIVHVIDDETSDEPG